MSSATKFIIASITKLYSPYCASSRVLASDSTKLLKHQSVTQSSGYRYLSSYSRMQNYNSTHRRNYSVYNGVQPGAPMPPQPPSSSLSWILGIVLTIILPFVGNKWGPLLKFKTEVDTAIETIEEIVEVVEKVAEVVDKVAEGISDDLPDDGKLKKAMDVVEDVAEKTAQDARTVGDAIDKYIYIYIYRRTVIAAAKAQGDVEVARIWATSPLPAQAKGATTESPPLKQETSPSSLDPGNGGRLPQDYRHQIYGTLKLVAGSGGGGRRPERWKARVEEDDSYFLFFFF
ncbi:UNVERIFIED_CONTAM: hypothetical protein Slati_2300300 [Sesamum latifolium]|uniref:Uncharacterized protein n=1 Tax=Sesamum latifolium TaxID=2727402 RepID=A0AAW2W9H1_9LAMI